MDAAYSIGIENDKDTSELKVQFYREAELDVNRSTELGRQIYRNVEYVKIIPRDADGAPDRNSLIVHEADEYQRKRFPAHYAAFKQATAEWEGEGLPLSYWPPMTPAKVKNYREMNIHTVEQLAEADVPEEEIEWRDKARAWLAQDVSGLKARIAELEAEVEALKAKRGPGRPKKEAA